MRVRGAYLAPNASILVCIIRTIKVTINTAHRMLKCKQPTSMNKKIHLKHKISDVNAIINVALTRIKFVFNCLFQMLPAIHKNCHKWTSRREVETTINKL